jgi:hypothetical protein
VTAQYFYCNPCRKKCVVHQKLFDTLNNFSKVSPEECPDCGQPLELHLGLDFQLGIGDGDFTVVHAFVPEKLESWLGEEEEEVTFYPFLVVLRRAGEARQFFWMPHWHVTGRDARYGQHAPCLDQAQFDSLVAQAQRKMLVPA